MSVFKKFLTEKRRRDYRRKGGQGGTRSTSSTPLERRESSANVQDPSNTRSKRLGTDKPRVIKAPDGSVTYTNMPEPSGSVTTDQVVDTADRKAKKGSPRGSGGGFGQSRDDAARYAGKPDTAQQAKVADDLRTKSKSPTVRQAAGNILGGFQNITPNMLVSRASGQILQSNLELLFSPVILGPILGFVALLLLPMIMTRSGIVPKTITERRNEKN